MGNKKKRGRERLLNCSACGRRVPRDKAVQFDRTMVYSTDMKTKDDVTLFSRVSNHYCPSCAKAKRIYEKKKQQLARSRERSAGRPERRPQGNTGAGTENPIKPQFAKIKY